MIDSSTALSLERAARDFKQGMRYYALIEMLKKAPGEPETTQCRSL